MSFAAKQIDDVTWQDVADLAASGIAEDAMLELKGLLPEKNGKTHPWYEGRDDLTAHTRDALAEEVVALANAYGGRLVIGIEETQDRPRKAKSTQPLPRCEKFAEQFEQALRGMVEPPIGGIHVKAIVDPATADSGAVIVAVPASDLAPHGIGRPPKAFVRRGTSCEPMTMRDLQAVFWEARTKRERIASIRGACRYELKDAFEDRGLLVPSAQTQALPSEDGLFVRITAIAKESLNLGPRVLASVVPQSRLSTNAFGDGWWMPFGGGQPLHGWRPRAHGLQGFDQGPSLWTVLDDGTVSLTGFAEGRPHQNLRNAHFPGSFVLHAAQVLVLADWLRREAGRPDIPIELDLELLHDGTAVGAESTGITPLYAGHINRSVEIGPVLFTHRAEAERVFRALELHIWNGMGFRVSSEARVAFSRWFSRSP